MRYLQVTHRYEIPLDVDPSDPDTESIVNSGISMMEAHMKGFSPYMEGIRSDWQWMPREYRPDSYVDAKPRSAGATDEWEGPLEGIQPQLNPGYPSDAPSHPWDQGLWLFPEDHPLANLERQAKRAYDEAEDEGDDIQARDIKRGVTEMQLRELGSGD